MKVRELFEMPELRNERADAVTKNWIDIKHKYLSFQTYDRLYNSLDLVQPQFVKETKELIFVGLSKRNLGAGTFIKKLNPETKHFELRLLCSLAFYHPSPLSKNIPTDLINPLQVQLVTTHSAYERQGIAAYLYATIVRNGYTIISDEVQYLGGKMLWKKMSREAKLSDYSITVYNHKTQEYLKDDTGNIIKYNASNIDDSLIWQENYLGRHKVFILQEE